LNGAGSSRGPTILIRTTLYNNTGKGISNLSDANATNANDQITIMVNCNVVSNGSDGLNIAPATAGIWQLHLQNCIFYGNGGFGVNSAVLFGIYTGSTNAFGANTSGAYGGTFVALPGDVTLSGDPFNGRTSNDFSLNNTAGAGAACRNAGFPGVLQNGGTGFGSIGALEISGGGGGTTIVIGRNTTTFMGEQGDIYG
jgi:hypothetical protein